MARPGAIVAAMKALPAGGRYSPVNAGGMGRISPGVAEAMMGGSYANAYGAFLDRPAALFTDGAFAPSAPIQPTPVNNPPPGAQYPGPRYWEPRPSWNLPTPPGSEGLKLASFDQLRTLAQKYSVARACIELRIEEIRSLDWNITLTTDAAKAYQKDTAAMKDFGERKKAFTKFFRRPDPDFWNFDSFLAALLEEIFVFDALALIFRPKYGAKIGMGGRGLLGSDLDSMRLISGPTIRPLIDVYGGKPAPPAPAYQQYLYGVPRSDYMTIAMGTDIEDAGLDGAQFNQFNADVMLYAPYWPQRESPYGFPPVERALLPIISGLQKQEFQLDYFTEGTVPAVYISPGDNNITPTQIGELQNALNSLAGDPSYHLKVIVLPPGSRVDPQRPVDLSDSFDYLVMNQVCMAFDVQPIELGIIPNVGGTTQGPSASGIRFMGQEGRDIKNRTSTKPLLGFLQNLFNHVIQDICDQHDMQFQFEGMIDDEDKQAITQLGVDQLQNGISSVDEIRERLDLPPWGMKETSEPIVMTQQGPVAFSDAQKLQMMALQGQQGSSSSSSSGSKKKSSSGKKPKPRSSGATTKPNGSHPAPNSPSRPSPATPAHAAAAGAVQRPQRGKTGGTASRSPVAGSRKRGEGHTPTQGRARNKAAIAELESLRRFLRKDRDVIWSWKPRHIDTITLAKIADDLDAGFLVDVAIEKAIVRNFLSEDSDDGPGSPAIPEDADSLGPVATAGPLELLDPHAMNTGGEYLYKAGQFPGWEHDLGLVGRYKEEISQAFQDAEIRGKEIRQKQAAGEYVTIGVLNSMLSDEIRAVFTPVVTALYEKAWDLGYEGGMALASGREADFARTHRDFNRDSWVSKESQHWVEEISRTGLGNSNARSEQIARTEVARAMGTGAGQAYRDAGVTHKHLLLAPDERTCQVCKSASSAGVLPLDAIYPGGEPPFHPQCVIGSTRVMDCSGLVGVSVREYVGEFITLRTASGNELTITPNHPIGTGEGWVPASELTVGDHVLNSLLPEWEMARVNPDVDNVPSRIEDVAKALPVALDPMPVSPEDFHGDGSGSDIYVVRTDSLLVNDGEASDGKLVAKHDLDGGDVLVGTSAALDATGDRFLGGEGLGGASYSFMSTSGESLALIDAGAGHSGEHSLAAVPRLDSGLQKCPADWGTADSEGFCERLLAFSGKIALDEIVHIERDSRRTQVYNLETQDGWYIANGIVTHNCRCVSAPAGVDAEPPQAHLRKRQEDKSRLAWTLLRAEDEDGKYRFLLQQRSDGTWGMPGGAPYVGEDSWEAAVRETAEEIGDLPALKVTATFHHVEDDGETQVYLYLCDVPYFQPKMNGSTPEETQGAAWFRKKEVGKLDLTSKFREDWEEGICLKDNANKSPQNMVSETGEQLVLDRNSAAGSGSRWPYASPAAANGYPSNKPPGGGQAPGEMGATEPPHWPSGDDKSDEETARIYPRGSDDEDYPKKRPGKGTPARRLPEGDPDGMYPQGGIAGDPGVGAQSVPGGRKKKGAPHPVVGVRPPVAGRPGAGKPVTPQPADPAEATEHLVPGEGNFVVDLPEPKVKKADDGLQPDAP